MHLFFLGDVHIFKIKDRDNIDESLRATYNASALYDAWCDSLGLVAMKGGFGDQAHGYRTQRRKENLLRSGNPRNSWDMPKKGV